jgi:hypothetical protein
VDLRLAPGVETPGYFRLVSPERQDVRVISIAHLSLKLARNLGSVSSWLKRIMKCPHCLTDFHDNKTEVFRGEDIDGMWFIWKRMCPACKRLVLSLEAYSTRISSFLGEKFFRPKASLRPSPEKAVPSKFVEDYIESCNVIADSPKANAALSRRCLQHILREIAKVKPSDLSSEIQEVLDSGKLPSHISESLDAIRNTGNFAAHPIKSKSSGEVLPVEPGEAEWNLDVLESLFDFYFVQPAIVKKKRDALNAKLKEAGKPAMK